MINPAAPVNFFIPIAIELGKDGRPATGVYVAQPAGGCWTPPRTRSAFYRRIAPGVICETWHWTRATPRTEVHP